MQNEKRVNRTTALGQNLFFVAYFILLMRALLQSSTLAVYLNVDGVFYHYIVRLFAYILIAFKLCLQDNFSFKIVFAYLVFAVLFFISVLFNRYLPVIEIALFVIGSHGVSIKKIVAEFFYVASITCGILFILSIFGVIENHIAYAGDIPRYSFGNIYPTDFAALIFYIQLSYSYIRHKGYNFITFAFWVLVAFLVLKFCRARLNFILILSFAIFMYAKALFPKVMESGFIREVFVWAIPACLIISIFIHCAYSVDNSFLSWVNKLLSGRLYYGHQAITDYGFSIFGTNIKMRGWGASIDGWDEQLGYYFIDSGWLSMTLRYGIIMTAVVCVSFVIVSKNSFKTQDYVMPIIILFLAVTSIVDHHVLEIGYNPFLVLIGVAIRQIFEPNELKKRKSFITKSEQCKSY